MADIKTPATRQDKLKFWQKKLKEYQKRYNELKKQSPGRWWHDEHFDNQMRVLESLIISTKQRVQELTKEKRFKI